MYKTTKQDFAYFESRVRYWYKALNLGGWNLCVHHTKLDGCRASVAIDDDGRAVTFFLTTEWNDNIYKHTKEHLDCAAKHEVLHLLVRPLGTAGYDRFTTLEELGRAEEELVVRLHDLIGGQV